MSLVVLLVAGCTPTGSLPATPPPPAACTPTARALRPAPSASPSSVTSVPSQPNDTANYPTAIISSLFQQIAAAQSPASSSAPATTCSRRRRPRRHRRSAGGAACSAPSRPSPAPSTTRSATTSAPAPPPPTAPGNETRQRARLHDEARPRRQRDAVLPRRRRHRRRQRQARRHRRQRVERRTAAGSRRSSPIPTDLHLRRPPRGRRRSPRPTAPSPPKRSMHKHPLTLELLGHWHRYQKIDERHVISGNAGAPHLARPLRLRARRPRSPTATCR